VKNILDIGSRHWKGEMKLPWGLAESLSRLVTQLELAKPATLPNLRLGRTLLLTCDFSGQHAGASYESFSFLLADLDECGPWNGLRAEVRRRILTDRRRMSFKGMNDYRRRRALLPFLRAANVIPGLTFTVALKKGLGVPPELAAAEGACLPQPFNSWSSATLRKLVLVSHLGALLVGGLSAKGQDLWWIIDEDDIAANEQRIRDVTSLVARITSAYLGHEMGKLTFGTTACDNGDLFIEDMAAISDLVAGAVSEVAGLDITRRISKVRIPLRGHVSRKTLNILGWLGNEVLTPLRKLAFLVDRGDAEGRIRIRGMDLSVENSS